MTGNPTWLRWNNLGIALLDENRFGEALDAFDEVVRLRPDYKDGLVNHGVALMSAGKFGEARASFAGALKLRHSDARTLFYLALVERHDGNAGAEIADLENVISQYPECRDARRELGIAYEREHRVGNALIQFEALQAIDPDDANAHQHLAALYRLMGQKAKADREQAQYNLQKPDPAAPSYSPEYIRRHPEILTEMAPGHIHQDLSWHSVIEELH